MTRLARWLSDFDTFLLWWKLLFAELNSLTLLTQPQLARIKVMKKSVKHSLNQVLWTWIVMLWCVVYTFFFHSCKNAGENSRKFMVQKFFSLLALLYMAEKVQTFFSRSQRVHNIFWRSTSILLWVRFYMSSCFCCWLPALLHRTHIKRIGNLLKNKI